jgi:hypothetical protein
MIAATYPPATGGGGDDDADDDKARQCRRRSGCATRRCFCRRSCMAADWLAVGLCVQEMK